MSEKELRTMLDHASCFCERRFAKKAEIAPMWICVTADGEEFTAPNPDMPTKDLTVAMVRAMFDLCDVVRYVYIGEAWTLARMIRPEEQDHIFRHGIADHPERVEVVQLQGEDQAWGQIIAQRRIIRPANGKPYLEPLEMVNDLPFIPQGAHVQSEGRMVGLLPVRGMRQ